MDLSERSGVDWDKFHTEMWGLSSGATAELQNEPTVISPESDPATDHERERFRAWIGEFVNWGSEHVLGKLFGVGCDIFFLMQFTYLYCSPGPDPLDEWARTARSLRVCL